VDAANAETITSEQIIYRPEILKILFRGSQLDLEVFDRLTSRKLSNLGAFWESGKTRPKAERRFAGNGYQRLRKSSRIRKRGDGKPGVSASYLWNLPELTPVSVEAILVDGNRLTPFRHERIHDPRPLELFMGPMFIIPQSPSPQTGRIRVSVTDSDMVFNEAYCGYSGRKHPDGKRLVRYLAMVLSSKCALWYALITSGEFGFERETIEKFLIDKLPVPAFDDLDSPQREQIDSLFEAVANEDTESAWERVDDWAATLYGLRKRDLEVISDTLKFNLPFAANRKAAQTPPTSPEVDVFCKTISSELNPLARRFGKKITAVRVDVLIASPWEVVRLSTEPISESPEMDEWPEILRIADQNAATEVIYPDPAQHCLWLARLGQARYWSRSQARLVARRVAWEHMGALLDGTE
jgi:hypothetical protein